MNVYLAHYLVIQLVKDLLLVSVEMVIGRLELVYLLFVGLVQKENMHLTHQQIVRFA
jgi:hypothetical protein